MIQTKDEGIIRQIIKRCKRIMSKIYGVSEDDFILDEDLIEVICFNVFQIGGLANGLSNEFVKEYNGIPWKHVIGMRHKIVHGYDTINFSIVWNTATESISGLYHYCLNIFK